MNGKLPAGRHRPGGAPGRREGFTLLELLVVAAVISLLAALMFPAVGAARRATQAARTKVQFTQWGAAIAAFRAEYGVNPDFDASALVNGGAQAEAGGDHLFHDILAGRRRDGSPLAGAGAAQNPRRIRFHGFTAAEFSGEKPGLLHDASGRAAMVVLVDRDLDGAIRFGPEGDYPTPPGVGGLTPRATDFPVTGIRANAAFYAPAPGSTEREPRFVLSWQ